MAKLALLLTLILLVPACTAAGKEEKSPKLSPKERLKIKKEVEYCEGQIATKDRRIMEQEQEIEELKSQLRDLKDEEKELERKIEGKIEEIQKLLEEMNSVKSQAKR